MRRTFFLALIAIALTGCASSPFSTGGKLEPSPAGMSDADRIRIAEAFRVAGAVGDSIWPGWTSAPFAVLLVTPEREFLIRHPHPSKDFTDAGYDPFLGANVFTRARLYQPTLLATFPAVGGVSTIVIGEAEHTGKNSTAWVLTLLHEHFHQWQTSQPKYYSSVAALDLSNGDESGMWMLNYPFPYDSSRIQQRVADLARALQSATAARLPAEQIAARNSVLRARAALKESLSEKDYRYLAFQLWQEGVARYTELAVARFAAERFKPSRRFRALPDYTTFSSAAAALSSEIQKGVADTRLGERKRVAVYPIGAAYALFLDWAAPNWRERYLTNLSLDPILP
jgi:hypothetical protein